MFKWLAYFRLFMSIVCHWPDSAFLSGKRQISTNMLIKTKKHSAVECNLQNMLLLYHPMFSCLSDRAPFLGRWIKRNFSVECVWRRDTLCPHVQGLSASTLKVERRIQAEEEGELCSSPPVLLYLSNSSLFLSPTNDFICRLWQKKQQLYNGDIGKCRPQDPSVLPFSCAWPW